MNDASDTVGVAQARKPSLAETPIPGNPDGKDVKLAVTARERRASTEPPTPDGEEPNEAELQTLRRVSGKIPWLAYSVAFVELCERFSYYGTKNLFTNYVQQPRPSSTGALYLNHGPNHGGHKASGALGKGQETATGLLTFNQFWSYIMPLLGGYIADTYLGRFATIQWSILWALVGHILIIVASLPPVMDNPDGAVAAFVLGLIIFGVGTGGFKANISPMVAEQIKDRTKRVKTLASGERVIVDPVVTISRVYLYYYFMINVGTLIGSITMVYAENYVGYWLAFLLPTIMFGFCPLVLWACKGRYHRNPPTGSVVGNSFKLIKLGMKGKWSVNPLKTLKAMKSDTFWDDIKPSRLGNDRPEWMTFDDAWVDQVRRGFAACKVFFWYPLYWLAYNQTVSNMTSQSATLKHDNVPSDLIQNFDPVALIIFIPICDVLLYPALRKLKIQFTPIKRITWGFGVASVSMVATCVLQYYIYKTGPCGSYMNDCDDTAPISIWIQVLPYVLVAFSEIFASITGLEYGFTKAPDNMRSLVLGVYLFQTAFASALNQALVPLSNDPLLVWNYGVPAVLAALGGVGFWATFYKLDRAEDQLNMLAESEFKGKMKPYGDAEGVLPLGAPTGADVEDVREKL